jgi:hypothetical protein
MSELEVSPMKEEDIDGAIATVQQAFAEDPYNKWIYNVRENVSTHFYPHNCFTPSSKTKGLNHEITVLTNP